MPSFEHYSSQTAKAKPETPAMGLYTFIKYSYCRDLLRILEKYKMIIKEDT